MDSNAAIPPAYVPPLPAQPKSRKKFWIILILSILLLIFVLIAGCCTLIYKGVGKVLRSSDVYAMSMKRAQDSPCAVSKLGQPIANDGMPQGSVNDTNSTGTADLTIPVEGPQGKGSLHAIGSRDNNVWTLTSLTLTTGATQIDLPPDPGPCQ